MPPTAIIKKADVLIIGPHADDPEFGISGTVAKWTGEGKKVAYVICTNGDKGTSDLMMDPHELIKIREKEQRDAAKVLGVMDVTFLGYPDQGLEDTADFRKEIVRQIRIFRPNVVGTTDPYRKYIWHRDHRICGQVVLDAVYPLARDYLAYPDLFSQGYKPHNVREVWNWGTDDPNHWVDITDTFEIKAKALSCHQSQVGGKDFSGVYDRIKQRATNVAKGRGFKFAEEFHRTDIWR